MPDNPELPDDVVEVLRNVRGDGTIEELRVNEEQTRNSPDLNEAFLSRLAVDAAELLRKYGYDT